MRKMFVVVFALFLLGGCASSSEKLSRKGVLIPQEEGLYMATGSHKDEEMAYKIALATAEQACLKQSKRHVVLNATTVSDDGLLSDRTAKVVNLATRVALLAGGFWSPIDGDDLRGNKKAQVKFKCE